MVLGAGLSYNFQLASQLLARVANKKNVAVQFDQRDLHPMTQKPSRASMVALSLVALIVAVAAAILGWLNY